MKKRSKVYFHLFISYLIIFLVPILLGTVIYSYAFRSVRRQEEKMNTNLLTMVQRDLDKEIDNIQKISARMAMDTGVQQASKVKGDFGSEDQMTLYYLYNDLQSTAMSEEFIKDIFVCFNNTQQVTCINGNMSARMYYSLYYDGGAFSFDNFKEYMGLSHYNDMLTLHLKSGEKTLIFTMTVLDSAVGKKSATVGIAVDYETIRKRLLAMKWDGGMDILVINENNDVISAGEEKSESRKIKYDELPEGSFIEKDNKGKSRIISVLKSEKTDWKYVAAAPASLIEKEARQIQNVAVIGLFFCIISGFAISGYLTRKNYNPIKALLETVKSHGSREMEENENEYQWLNRQMNQFFQEQVNSERLLADNRKNLKNYYLIQLLQDYYNGRSMEPYGIHLHMEYNMVMLFAPEVKKDDMQENALQKFIITNIFEELCLNHFGVEMVEIGERAAAVINLPTEENRHIQTVKELAENLQQMTEESFGFTVRIFAGSISKGLEGIHLSYLQACDMEEYLNLLDTSLILYDEVKNIQPEYDYPVEMEEKIINAMKVGDCKQAGQTMRQVFDKNLTGKVSANIYRCLIYDMIGTLLKAANAGGWREAAGELEFPDPSKVRQPVEEVKAQFEVLLEKICEKIVLLEKEASQDRSLSKKIRKYISENYMDPDLNISITSQHFDMTPNYLSLIYKKQTGGSLLDYINTMRLERGRKLLESGKSVVEAAEQTGFRDSGTFIRAFKKKYGITPGQLKKKS